MQLGYANLDTKASQNKKEFTRQTSIFVLRCLHPDMNTLFQRKSGGQDEVEKKLLQLPEPPLVDQIVADLEDATPSDVVFNSGLFFSTCQTVNLNPDPIYLLGDLGRGWGFFIVFTF